MKNAYLFLLLSVLLTGCQSDDNAHDPCAGHSIWVNVNQLIRLITPQGNWSTIVDFEGIKLIPTDKNWNIIYDAQGNIYNAPNIIEAFPVYDTQNNIDYIQLTLGRTSLTIQEDQEFAYFLLQVNDNKRDKVITGYNTDCGDLILSYFSFNGTEYPVNDMEGIDVVIE